MKEMCSNENFCSVTSKPSRIQYQNSQQSHPDNSTPPLSSVSPTQNLNPTTHLASTNQINSDHNSFIQQSNIVHSSAPTTTNMSTMLTAPSSGLLSLDHYRLQLYNYAMAERIRCAQYSQPIPQICSNYPAIAAAAAMSPYGPRLALSMSLFHNRVFQPEEPKPQHSYIGLIAMAILSAPELKLVLSDIYQHILDNYPYFRSRGPGWRNSIRHNLSLNDCFVKAGRSANGKGHYWAIHPANQEDFKKGDFRRRKAQRKVRKHMGLAVDDEGADSPSPPPISITPPPVIANTLQNLCASGTTWGIAGSAALLPPSMSNVICHTPSANTNPLGSNILSAVTASHYHHHHHHMTAAKMFSAAAVAQSTSRKRQFDVASLLAPDRNEDIEPNIFNKPINTSSNLSSGPACDIDEDIDVEAGGDHERDQNVLSRDNHKRYDLELFNDDATPPFDRNLSRNISIPSSGYGLSGQQQFSDDVHKTQLHSINQPTESGIDDENSNTHHSHKSNFSTTPPPVQPLSSNLPALGPTRTTSWQGFIQQWPPASGIDPRVLVGRYYGQYMNMAAAAGQHQTQIRCVNNNNINNCNIELLTPNESPPLTNNSRDSSPQIPTNANPSNNSIQYAAKE